MDHSKQSTSRNLLGCKHLREIEGGRPAGDEHPLADETSHFVDYFSEGNTNTTATLTGDGTDITWPAGWNEDQAMEWRAGHKLLPY
jgi:hypothetical protein